MEHLSRSIGEKKRGRAEELRGKCVLVERLDDAACHHLWDTKDAEKASPVQSESRCLNLSVVSPKSMNKKIVSVAGCPSPGKSSSCLRSVGKPQHKYQLSLLKEASSCLNNDRGGTATRSSHGKAECTSQGAEGRNSLYLSYSEKYELRSHMCLFDSFTFTRWCSAFLQCLIIKTHVNIMILTESGLNRNKLCISRF